MKFSLSLLAVAGLTAAAPTKTTKQNAANGASVTDQAFGYASQNGGTTGGAGGTTVTVTSYAEFTAAVTSDDAKVVIVDGKFTQAADQVKVGSNTSIIGKNSGAGLVGTGLLIKNKSNVIIRNLAISSVLAENGDALGVQYSTNVWIDHVDVSSNLDHDKDYYDGLIDITHASDYVTISNTFFHDHWKACLIGHSDSNGDEDTGHLRVTLANNYWYNVNSRGPSIRFGTGHIYNSYYEKVSNGINTRDAAQVLVESNTFVGSEKPLYSTDSGYAVANDNDFGDGANEAEAGTLKTVPYSYTLLGSAEVKAAVVGTAGNTLSF